MPTETTPSDVQSRLAAKFTRAQTRFRVGFSNEREGTVQALPFIPSNVVEDRLDEVLGMMNWSTDYRVVDLPTSRMVVCRLRVTDPETGREAAREGVAYVNELTDAGLRRVFSEALRVAATKLGVGRYLFEHPVKFYRYKNGFLETPELAPGFYSDEEATDLPAEASDTPAEPNQETSLPQEGAGDEKGGAPGPVQDDAPSAAKAAIPGPSEGGGTVAADDTPADTSAAEGGEIPGLNTNGMSAETISAVKHILDQIPTVAPTTVRTYLVSKKAASRFPLEVRQFLLARLGAWEEGLKSAEKQAEKAAA